MEKKKEPVGEGQERVCMTDMEAEQRARHQLDGLFSGELPPPIVKILWAVPVPAFPPDALLQLKQRNGERKLAAATALAKLESADQFMLTPPPGKRVAEGAGVVDEPTKMAKTHTSSDSMGVLNI